MQDITITIKNVPSKFIDYMKVGDISSGTVSFGNRYIPHKDYTNFSFEFGVHDETITELISNVITAQQIQLQQDGAKTNN